MSNKANEQTEKNSKVALHFPFGKPLKKKRKQDLTQDLVSGFHGVGITAKVEDSARAQRAEKREIGESIGA